MPTRPNILLIASDEHSFRFLSKLPHAQGGEPCQTPTLDGLIERGTWCTNAYCQMPLCTPSRISMLSGRHSHRCGAWGNGSILDPQIPTLAAHLGQAGYATATVGKLHLGGSLQYAGFQARPYGDFGGPPGHQYDPLTGYEQNGAQPGMDMRSRTADAGLSQVPESLLQEQMVVRESLAWLREQQASENTRPWLLFSSFSRPHFPLTAPRRFLERYWPDGVTPPRVEGGGDSGDHPMTLGAIKGFQTDIIPTEEMMRARAAYFACVDQLDQILGDFLALLDRDGLLDNTVIVYTSDHGEMAGEHGLFWKNTWHEASARVPLLFSLPQQRRGQLAPSRIDTPTSLVDLFPTFCGLSDTQAPEGLDGIDLSPALAGDPCPALAQRPGVLTESLAPRWGAGTEFRMMRSARYKYVAFRGCDDLAFDLWEDPDEQRNIAQSAQGDAADELAQLRRQLLDGFDFDAVEAQRRDEGTRLKQLYPAKTTPQTPNQIWRGDGVLVEADQPLYEGQIVSRDPAGDFDDFPAQET